MPVVSHESNSYSLNLAENTKLSKIWPQVIAVKRKAKNDLVWKLISDVWDLAESSRPNRWKGRSSVIKNIQNPPYDFSIFKVMTVCTNAYASFRDIFSFTVTELSQADNTYIQD